MAAALGIVAIVIAVIQISENVIKVCRFYIESLHDAPTDLRAILIETSTVKAILENLHFLFSSGVDDGFFKVLNSYNLFGLDGPIEGCKKTIEKMDGLFPAPSSNKSKVRSAFAALAWPLKESKAKRLLMELVQYKTTISLAITAESRQDIKEMKKQTTEIHAIITESQRHEIYKWLHTTDPSPLHHRAVSQYEPRTGDWFLRTQEWKDWVDGKPRCLWIHGIPGAGKTILAPHLIETVKELCRNRGSRRCTYAYYYCYFGHSQDEVMPFLRWTLNRLCHEAATISAKVYQLFKQGGQPNVLDLLDALEAVLDEFDNVYLFTDAVDESMSREGLLKVLRDISIESRFKKIQLLATSRQYKDIEDALTDISLPVSMSNPLLDEDIRLYVRAKVDTHPRIRRWPTKIRDEAVEALSCGAKGMFRWVVCQIDALQRLKPESHIVRNALRHLPKTLDETYERIFIAILDEDRIFVRLALHWIWFYQDLNAKHIALPLLLQAIEHCISESASPNMDCFYDEDILRELCGCLILVSKPKDTQQYSTVSLAHCTVSEFLESPRILLSAGKFFAMKRENTTKELMRITLLEIANNPPHDTEVWVDLDCRIAHKVAFNSFCNATLKRFLGNYCEELIEDTVLTDLVFKVLDAAQPHFPRLAEISDDYPSAKGANIRSPLWGLEWNNSPVATGVAPLISLLLWIDCANYPSISSGAGGCAGEFLSISHGALRLAGKFLRKVGNKELLDSLVDIDHPVECSVSKERFRGSILEFIAQLEFFSTNEFSLWSRLMKHASDFIETSKALLALLPSHVNCDQHENCTYDNDTGDDDDTTDDDPGSSERCALRCMLKMGASTADLGYKVTPLQIAVNCRDVNGVKILLEVGADANGTGDSEGVDWIEGTFLSIFNHLHGPRPIEIVRRTLVLSRYVSDYYEEERQQCKIEAEREIERILVSMELQVRFEETRENLYKGGGLEALGPLTRSLSESVIIP